MFFGIAQQTSAGLERGGARRMIGVTGVTKYQLAVALLGWIENGVWDDRFPVSGEADWSEWSPLAIWDDEVATA